MFGGFIAIIVVVAIIAIAVLVWWLYESRLRQNNAIAHNILTNKYSYDAGVPPSTI